jgi:hypothetical protein
VTVTTMEDPPGFLVTSDAGLESPAATLDLAANVQHVTFAEPSRL